MNPFLQTVRDLAFGFGQGISVVRMQQFSGYPVKQRLIHKLLTDKYRFSIEYQAFRRGAGARNNSMRPAIAAKRGRISISP